MCKMNGNVNYHLLGIRHRKNQNNPLQGCNSTVIHSLAILNKANLFCVAAEALSAAHQTIFSNQSMGVPTDTAGARSRAVVFRVRIPDVGVPHLPLSTQTSSPMNISESPNRRYVFDLLS